MNRLKFLRRVTFFLLVILHLVSAKIFNYNKDDRFEILMEKVATVLQTCSPHNLLNIGLVKDSNVIIESNKIFKYVTLLNVDPTKNESQNASSRGFAHLLHASTRHKLDIYMTIHSSSTKLHRTLNAMSKSGWWNSATLHVLIDSETRTSECQNAGSFLRASWRFDMLRSIFACIDPVYGPTFYTFNPFEARAPSSWQLAKTDHEVSNSRVWTMFKQSYRPGHTNCKDLNYDKTIYLNQHVVRALAIETEPILTIDYHSTGLERLHGFDGMIARTLWSKLGGNLSITMINASLANAGQSKYNQHSQDLGLGPLTSVMSGQFDILLNQQFIFNKPNLTTTFPHINSGISVITRYMGYEPVSVRILRFMNPWVILGISVVALITTMTLAILMRRGPITASLEVLRMIIGNAMLGLPRRHHLRIYTIAVIFLFLVTGSVFQGNLSSMLTKSVPKSNVDGIVTLKESGYKIYAYRGYENAFYDPKLIANLILTDDWNCSSRVIDEEAVACAADHTVLVKIAYDSNLYLSRHRLATLYAAYVVRPHWPLVDRMNMLLTRLSDGGLLNYSWDINVHVYRREWRKYVAEMKNRTYRVITMEEIKFAFVILISGLCVAATVFVLEIAIFALARKDIRKIKGQSVKSGGTSAGPILPFVN